MNQYDQRNYRFHRTDPTGRHSPLHIPRASSEWAFYLGGAAMGCVLALLLYWGMD